MKTSLKNRLIPGHPVTGRERRSVGTEDGGPRPISDREFARCHYRILQIKYVDVAVESKIYRFAVPVLKSNQNLLMSRSSRAGTAKKCTKKRDARCRVVVLLIKLIAFLTFPLPKTGRQLSPHGLDYVCDTG